MSAYLCAVDVGTRSARAAVFDAEGHMHARQIARFDVRERGGAIAEYRFQDIWAAVCDAVRRACAESALPDGAIRALAFDATCSLVLADQAGAPLALDPDGSDTIAWFDHRAVTQAEVCTQTAHRLITHLGGAMSPEMQTPKLMWLKQNRPDLWQQLGSAQDLADALVSRAAGTRVHSVGTLAAKWAYLPDHGGWQTDFLEQVGLPDLLSRAGLSQQPAMVATRAGALCDASARDLGLPQGTPIAAGMIDAMAGAMAAQSVCEDEATGRCTALITGTSSTVICSTREPVFAKGAWGPFRDIVAPGLWTLDAGQSAAGALLDYVLALWPQQSEGRDVPTHAKVLDRIAALQAEQGWDFAYDLHVLPDFNGNRSPFADPFARGVVSGLTLDRSFDAQCALYWRTAVSLALGARQILDHLSEQGLASESLFLAGGLSRSPLLVQLFADATGRVMKVPRDTDGVLMGTAIAASVAGGLHPDIHHAARAMTGDLTVIKPNPKAHAQYQRDLAAFRLMQDHRTALARL